MSDYDTDEAVRRAAALELLGEHEQLQRENAELKAMVNELRDTLAEIYEWKSHTAEFSLDYGSNGVRDLYREKCVGVLNKTSAQSLADHDRTIAERVREACWGKTCAGCGCKCSEAIRNMDIDEALKK